MAEQPVMRESIYPMRVVERWATPSSNPVEAIMNFFGAPISAIETPRMRDARRRNDQQVLAEHAAELARKEYEANRDNSNTRILPSGEAAAISRNELAATRDNASVPLVSLERDANRARLLRQKASDIDFLTNLANEYGGGLPEEGADGVYVQPTAATLPPPPADATSNLSFDKPPPSPFGQLYDQQPTRIGPNGVAQKKTPAMMKYEQGVREFAQANGRQPQGVELAQIAQASNLPLDNERTAGLMQLSADQTRADIDQKMSLIDSVRQQHGDEVANRLFATYFPTTNREGTLTMKDRVLLKELDGVNDQIAKIEESLADPITQAQSSLVAKLQAQMDALLQKKEALFLRYNGSGRAQPQGEDESQSQEDDLGAADVLSEEDAIAIEKYKKMGGPQDTNEEAIDNKVSDGTYTPAQAVALIERHRERKQQQSDRQSEEPRKSQQSRAAAPERNRNNRLESTVDRELQEFLAAQEALAAKPSSDRLAKDNTRRPTNRNKGDKSSKAVILARSKLTQRLRQLEVSREMNGSSWTEKTQQNVQEQIEKIKDALQD